MAAEAVGKLVETAPDLAGEALPYSILALGDEELGVRCKAV